MPQEKYNGWTNYETWCLALWLGNEQSSESYWSEQAEEAWESAEAGKHFTRKENAVFALADQLKEQTGEANPLAERSDFWSGILSAALGEINWCEIAEHYMEDMPE